MDEPMESLESLIFRVLPQVIPCPRSMVMDAMQQVAVDFCRRSGAWRVLMQVNAFRGDHHIPLDPVRGVHVVRCNEVYVDGSELDRGSWQLVGDELVLKQPLPRDMQVLVCIELRPARTSEKLPESLLEAWGDVLCQGAMARLKAMSGANIGWADPQGAMLNQSLFEDGVTRARTKAFRNRRGGGTLYAGA